MECISVFDMLKIGVGPSSSHTLGPWRAAEQFLAVLKNEQNLEKVAQVNVLLYGSLSLTGKGHATDVAAILGLLGKDPVTIDCDTITPIITNVKETSNLCLDGKHNVKFSITENIQFLKEFLPYHANGITFEAILNTNEKVAETYYSIGGGFVAQEKKDLLPNTALAAATFPYPIQNGEAILHYCNNHSWSISELVLENERALRTDAAIDEQLQHIWQTMLESMYLGCHTQGILPGGLQVKRRAFDMNKNLIGDKPYKTPQQWIEAIRDTEVRFRQIIKWVSCFALAVNEVNASLGRVVTAPTNGSAGVIPAVLMYYLVIENHDGNFEDIKRFLLVAGEVGSIFKKGATISAAMGGCQAEIGVSSAMAAAGLTELMGGTPEQVLMAAEIAMEHHLGLTCDPIGGLVQVPCIERNTMGAIKAINASELALDSDPSSAKVPLDKVVNTMWETAKDMSSKYKETSEGGLAVGVNLSDC